MTQLILRLPLTKARATATASAARPPPRQRAKSCRLPEPVGARSRRGGDGWRAGPRSCWRSACAGRFSGSMAADWAVTMLEHGQSSLLACAASSRGPVALQFGAQFFFSRQDQAVLAGKQLRVTLANCEYFATAALRSSTGSGRCSGCHFPGCTAFRR